MLMKLVVSMPYLAAYLAGSKLLHIRTGYLNRSHSAQQGHVHQAHKPELEEGVASGHGEH